MAPGARRIAILAGGGSLPLEFARSAHARGELATVVAIDGFADADFGELPVVRVGMAEVGRMLKAFKAAGAGEIVIIGPARRPDLRRVKPDLGFFLALPQILRILSSGGDDGVLTGVVRFFESKGFRVLGPRDVAPETLAPSGLLTTAKPSSRDLDDVARGFALIRLLGDLDVGQAVIVSDGHIEAIEGAEGTDRMLARVADARRHRHQTLRAHARAGILVKRPKPGQELRVDMPSIGPGTVTGAAAAGLGGIAVHAGHVLMAERSELLRRAEHEGLFVLGAEDLDDRTGEREATCPDPRHALDRIGRHRVGARESFDVARAAAVSRRLAPYRCGEAVAVAKGHVLAAEAGGEGAAGVLARVDTLRNRVPSRPPKRAGAAYFSGSEPLTGAMVAAVAHARLAGIAVGDDEAPRDDVVEACDSAGLFVVRLRREEARGRDKREAP